MWFKNKETGLEFDVDYEDLIKNLKNDSNFEEIQKEDKKEKNK